MTSRDPPSRLSLPPLPSPIIFFFSSSFFSFFLRPTGPTCRHVDDPRASLSSLPFERFLFHPLEKIRRRTKVRRGWIPKREFVFPRWYLLFHGAMHRMNGKGSLLYIRDSFARLVLRPFHLPRFTRAPARIPFGCVFLLKGDDEWLLG